MTRLARTSNIPAISSGPFTATPTGLIIDAHDPVPYEVWQAYGAGLQRVAGAIQWVIGDWLNFGDAKYGETYSQALALWPEAEYGTLAQQKRIASQVQISTRVLNLSWGHHREVAPLETLAQREWLAKAEQARWSVRELREAIARKRAEDSPPLPEDKFSVIYADPPWRYDFSLTDNRKIENQYPTMETEVIAALAIPAIAATDSVLFLWVPSPKLPQGLFVLEAWGFEYKTCMIWVKEQIGMGYYARQKHELLLIGARGSLPLPEPAVRPESVFVAPRTRHSEKPQMVYELIEIMYPHGKYVELFARTRRAGWEAWGNEGRPDLQTA